jgi:hypothetical protein
VNSVLPVTGGLMLLVSLTRLAGIVFLRENERKAHEPWSG